MFKKIKFLIHKKYRLQFYLVAFLNFFGSLLETIGLALLPISIVYIIGFALSIYLLVKKDKNQPKE